MPETVEVQSKKNDTVHTYLKDNTTPIYWDYPLEDADFGNADYRVFLAGETRGQPQNTAMRKALFQYLHEQQGVNVQLVETGVGETQVLEQYSGKLSMLILSALGCRQRIMNLSSKSIAPYGCSCSLG